MFKRFTFDGIALAIALIVLAAIGVLTRPNQQPQTAENIVLTEHEEIEVVLTGENSANIINDTSSWPLECGAGTVVAADISSDGQFAAVLCVSDTYGVTFGGTTGGANTSFTFDLPARDVRDFEFEVVDGVAYTLTEDRATYANDHDSCVHNNARLVVCVTEKGSFLTVEEGQVLLHWIYADGTSGTAPITGH